MKENKIYILFIYLSLIFGTLFVFLTPPFQSPDEDSHFKKAYTISKFDIYPSIGNNHQGYYLPYDMVEYINVKKAKMSERDWKYTYKELYDDNFVSVDYSNETFSDFSTRGASIVSYVPSAMGIFIARHTSRYFIRGQASTAYMLYFARFFNLLFYTIIMALAIKMIPILKKTIFFIGLLPMSLFLGSMVTYDCLLLSICTLTIALILKLIYDKKAKFDMKYLIYFIVVGYILLKVKLVYSLILLLLFLVPKDKFKEQHKIKYALYLLVGVIGLYVLSKIPYLFIKTSSSSNSAIGDQITFIKNNPLKVGYIIFKNIYAQKFARLIEMIGVLGLLDTYMPIVIIMLYVTILLLLSISELSLSKIKIDLKTKLFALGIFIVVAFGIYMAMYVSWTPKVLGVGGDVVSGVQGRYYLPILILLLFIFSNQKLKNYKWLKKVMEFIMEHYFIISIIGLIVASLMLLFRYWC